jgi:hypothetical protein
MAGAICPLWSANGGMQAIKVFLAACLFTVLVSPAQAEECQAGRTGADGEPQTTAIIVDLASSTRLDPAALPERTSAVACRRSSIVPMPDDVRVLIEWAVAFGIAEQGPRVLWIWARAGRLRFTVDHGELSIAERAAVDDWLKAAQARFAAALGRR